nr:LysM peptidoglycan-binding domain-containing protein [Spirochaetota bacterium]
AETGLYYHGARYRDAKTGVWLSVDPYLANGNYFPVPPVNDKAKERNKNLPGMGGVFNSVNLNGYHYAGNNPVRFVDPDGNFHDESVKVKYGDKDQYEFTINKGKVEKGDSLWSISQKQLQNEGKEITDKAIMAKIDVIKSRNGLKSNKLEIGQELYLGTSGAKDNTNLFNSGYVDLNLSGGYHVGFTTGLIFDLSNGDVYIYGGAGYVTPGVSGALTISPDSVGEGFCLGVQGQQGIAGQFGYSFAEKNGGGFWEVGAGWPSGFSVTGYYVKKVMGSK